MHLPNRWFIAAATVCLAACSPATGTDGGTETGGGSSGSAGGSASTGGGSGNAGGGAASNGGGTGSTGGGSATTGGGSATTGGGSATTGGGSGSTGGGTGAQKMLGETCGTSGECSSGFCVDNVCCNTACNGSCQACSTARTGALAGVCSPVPNGEICRAAAGACDVAEVCSNGTCAPDSVVDAGVACRAANGICDVAETCDGVATACPAEAFVDAGVTCRAATGLCDRPETCTGSAGACPSDELFTAGTTCRAAAGLCDIAELCNGTTDQCPADQLRAQGFSCRASAGTCDVGETCSGSSPACPNDAFLPSTSLACAPYRCTGSAAACTTSCANTSADCAPDSRSACNVNVCQPGRLVFATSTTHLSNFGVGTVGGTPIRADQICNDLATDAGLGGTFRSWLSDLTSSPSARFTRDGGVWVRNGDKALIARDWADLTDGTIGATISTNERRATVTFSQSGVLTGSTIVGTSATFSGGNTNTHCSGWASTSNQNFGTRGSGTETNSNWTNASNTPCGTLMGARLYCFEQ